MNILITNSVPANGGDEALLLAIILGIKAKLPNAKINVLCNNPVKLKDYIDFAILDWDWEYTWRLKKNFLLNNWYKVRKIFELFGIPLYSKFSIYFASKEEMEIINLYKEADFILSTAGGYINDRYGYENRRRAFEMALSFQKRLIFIAQSIGPFYSEYQKKHNKIKNVFKKAFHIFLREHLSKKHLEDIGYSESNITVTSDIAFSLYNHYKNLFIMKKVFNKRIVVNFRRWDYEDSLDFICYRATEIVLHLIKKGYHVTFLSTCQGLDYYTNDAELGKIIMMNLPDDSKNSFFIDSNKYKVPDLIKIYSEYDVYIGMRLHGAILSMLGGTPAFNLGYEDKTEGIFEFCGLSDYQCKYNSDISEILNKIDQFLNSYDKINLREIIEKCINISEMNFKYFDNNMSIK